jgi:hypothetical protein
LVSASAIRQRRYKIMLINKLAGFTKLFLLEKLRRIILKLLRLDKSDYAQINSPKLKETFKNVINEDQSPYLSAIKIPTLVIWGEKDAVTPLKEGKLIAKSIPNAKLSVIKNAGHFRLLEKPEEFIKLIKEGLGESSYKKVFNNSVLGYKSYLRGNLYLFKEGISDDLIESFNGKFDCVSTNFTSGSNHFETSLEYSDLKLIDSLVNKIEDKERKGFAKLLFYRYGYRTNFFEKEIALFKNAFHAFLKEPLLIKFVFAFIRGLLRSSTIL